MQDNSMDNEILKICAPTVDIRRIDAAGFYAFGALYILFNVIYWPIFLFIPFY